MELFVARKYVLVLKGAQGRVSYENIFITNLY